MCLVLVSKEISSPNNNIIILKLEIIINRNCTKTKVNLYYQNSAENYHGFDFPGNVIVECQLVFHSLVKSYRILLTMLMFVNHVNTQ